MRARVGPCCWGEGSEDLTVYTAIMGTEDVEQSQPPVIMGKGTGSWDSSHGPSGHDTVPTDTVVTDTVPMHTAVTDTDGTPQRSGVRVRRTAVTDYRHSYTSSHACPRGHFC